ncbi:hypothetical protein DL96DRAFT_1562732 [Flagelloscypha sp. PMI_526]|nr:hypothetical protein DL96DRAFT_1562732 [Flagelloscypha sp. PMI_526]
MFLPIVETITIDETTTTNLTKASRTNTRKVLDVKARRKVVEEGEEGIILRIIAANINLISPTVATMLDKWLFKLIPPALWILPIFTPLDGIQLKSMNADWNGINGTSWREGPIYKTADGWLSRQPPPPVYTNFNNLPLPTVPESSQETLVNPPTSPPTPHFVQSPLPAPQAMSYASMPSLQSVSEAMETDIYLIQLVLILLQNGDNHALQIAMDPLIGDLAQRLVLPPLDLTRHPLFATSARKMLILDHVYTPVKIPTFSVPYMDPLPIYETMDPDTPFPHPIPYPNRIDETFDARRICFMLKIKATPQVIQHIQNNRFLYLDTGHLKLNLKAEKEPIEVYGVKEAEVKEEKTFDPRKLTVKLKDLELKNEGDSSSGYKSDFSNLEDASTDSSFAGISDLDKCINKSFYNQDYLV